MMKRLFSFIASVTIAFLAIQSNTAFCASKMSSPVTLSKIKDFLSHQQVTSIEEFLQILPDDQLGNAVLMNESQSLQQASYTNPRTIYFGMDARMLIAVSSIPTDPRYHFLELSEYHAKDGKYYPSTIQFSSSGTHLDEHPTSCKLCHGPNWQPIWGTYNHWNGAYGSSTGEIEQSGGFKSFLLNTKIEPHLKPLGIEIEDTGNTFITKLKLRKYSYPNVVFGMLLMENVSRGLFTRLRSNALYQKLRWPILASLMCDPQTPDFKRIKDQSVQMYTRRTNTDVEFRTQYQARPIPDYWWDGMVKEGSMRLMDLDSERDLIKSSLKENGGGNWYDGFGILYQLAQLRMLDEAVLEFPELAAIYSDSNILHSNLARIDLVGEPRIKAAVSEVEREWHDVLRLYQTRNAIACRFAAKQFIGD